MSTMEAATTSQQAVPPPRLRDTYNDEVLPKLMEKFGYSTPMRAPRLQKITLNMGLGSSFDTKSREKAIGEEGYLSNKGLIPLPADLAEQTMTAGKDLTVLTEVK